MRSRSVFALLFVPLVGCISLDIDLGGKSWGGGSESLTTGRPDATASSRVVHITDGDRVEMLLLIEGSGSGGVSGGNPPSGAIWTPSGRVVNWTCLTRRGELHKLRIDDIIFPFDGGRVFHVDVRGEKVLVTHIDLNPHELASGKGSIRENVRANAARHPVIAGFFERCDPPE